jgi:hypothetical protein
LLSAPEILLSALLSVIEEDLLSDLLSALLSPLPFHHNYSNNILVYYVEEE